MIKIIGTRANSANLLYKKPDIFYINSVFRMHS